MVRLFREGSLENLDQLSDEIARDIEAAWVEARTIRLTTRPSIVGFIANDLVNGRSTISGGSVGDTLAPSRY